MLRGWRGRVEISGVVGVCVVLCENCVDEIKVRGVVLVSVRVAATGGTAHF
jgi:hypothetical protein